MECKEIPTVVIVPPMCVRIFMNEYLRTSHGMLITPDFLPLVSVVKIRIGNRVSTRKKLVFASICL